MPSLKNCAWWFKITQFLHSIRVLLSKSKLSLLKLVSLPQEEKGEEKTCASVGIGELHLQLTAARLLLHPYSLHPLHFLQFRFANTRDRFMILVGVVTGILSGLALPGHNLMLGEVINEFTYFTLATEEVRPRVISFVNNGTLNTMNLTVDDILCNRRRTRETLDMFSSNGTDVYFCSLGDIFENILDYTCDPQDKLITSVSIFSYIYLAMAVGLLVTAFVSNALLNLSAYRQTHRMRLAFYRSVLNQEIGWFDVTESRALNIRLAE